MFLNCGILTSQEYKGNALVDTQNSPELITVHAANFLRGILVIYIKHLIMGSGVWFKNIMSIKKRGDRSQKLKARKNFCRLKAPVRFQSLLQCDAIKKEASTTLGHLHSWTKIQAQIRARRVHMVTEGRLRQKKLESQSKLELKLHDLEVEWSGCSETMDEALARIHQREEAALRRERAMAYAFSHQWRANSNPNFGSSNHDIGKSNWGWSWIDRWIAARPWESRAVPLQSSPKKSLGCQSSKNNRNKNSPTIIAPVSVTSISPNGKTATKARKLSYGAAEKMIGAKKLNKSKVVKTRREKEISS
ncbi:unnamed protein product [Fraxinus pennsylvanica]|uniref:Protein IQ-DOMAIN 1 n=1 Tax=Fraxinus pennsylvanica TaxID=56036 RepID=A0AAD2ACE1_9LAMI|nr:unnamed protein product [Fraxinus pennsylvanica]